MSPIEQLEQALAEPELELDLSGLKMAELWQLVGGLSSPSKMPGYGYSLPAAECKQGSRLRKVARSVCSGCYALKGRYVFPNVLAAMYRRLGRITSPLWAPAMAELIERKRLGAKARPLDHFRWHDSGDIQSLDHMRAIARVAELTPNVKHWLPSREYRLVRQYFELEPNPPANLNVRLSAHMLGGRAPRFPGLPLTVSTVSAGDPPAGAYRCPAPTQGNSCGSCRACWDPNVKHVDYHLH